MERLRKLLAEVETDEDPYFDHEDNGPEDVLEEIFSEHERFCEHDTQSEEDEDSGNEDVNKLNFFYIKRALDGEKQNVGKIFVVIILCRTYLEQKHQRKMPQAL
ncbi:hypothetical protein AVEN_106612-1 [Araneus ventricosus]|uniref:Uncharacterized protein n=1 Tax=Araneus ventricosus TaxID=182803 RepID=A0A4Y2NM14_ARAVE|nr:hypothetical protein AVEN_106612-1 [Araneus ventricosus]